MMATAMQPRLHGRLQLPSTLLAPESSIAAKQPVPRMIVRIFFIVVGIWVNSC